MSITTSRRISAGMVAASLALLTCSSALTVLRGNFTGNNSFDLAYIPLTFVGAGIYLWVGRLIVSRQPTNTIGWLLLTIPLVTSFSLANGAYATRALVTAPGTLPAGLLSAWIDRWAIVPMLSAFIPIFLLYPNGRLPSPRWRPILWLTIAGPAVTTVAFALTPGRLTGAMANLETTHFTNPLGVRSLGSSIESLTLIGGWATFFAAIASGVAIVVRYRYSDGEVRQQERWLAVVAMAFFVELVIMLTGIGLTHDKDRFGNVMFLVWFLTLILGIPIACGIAILKYRLYDLDVVVRRTVVFGLLAVFIAVVYVAIVGGVGALVGSRSSGVLSFAAAATLAVLFQPARDRARRVADRLVYGKRATPYEVLAEFSGRVGEAYSNEDVLPRMAQLLAEGTGATSGTVWLRIGSELRPEASWPSADDRESVRFEGDALPNLVGGHAVEVRDGGELLGALTVAMPASDPMDPTKEKLVRDLAGQAGLVLRNVRLIKELRASRQRLVAAQDEERRKIERNLHDGAQQQLVALSVQLKLLEQLAGRDTEKERELAAQLQHAASGAIEELREIARGIYPPLLADQGLAAALESQARKAAVPTTIETDGIGRYSREVEAAVYFSAMEALNNVAKYAKASRAVVRLSRADGHLRLDVHDDGVGFDPSATGYGTGLQGMADRMAAVGGDLWVESTPGSGTTVSGRVPVGGDGR
jgi:signal transduction histidine kinase